MHQAMGAKLTLASAKTLRACRERRSSEDSFQATMMTMSDGDDGGWDEEEEMEEDARKNERGFCYATRSALGNGKLGKSCLPATAVGLRKLGRARPIGCRSSKKLFAHTRDRSLHVTTTHARARL